MTEENSSVKIPLPDYIHDVAKEAAREMYNILIAEHINSCSAAKEVPELRRLIRVVELRFAALIGAMLGSGILGGSVVGVIMKFIG